MYDSGRYIMSAGCLGKFQHTHLPNDSLSQVAGGGVLPAGCEVRGGIGGRVERCIGSIAGREVLLRH